MGQSKTADWEKATQNIACNTGLKQLLRRQEPCFKYREELNLDIA